MDNVTDHDDFLTQLLFDSWVSFYIFGLVLDDPADTHQMMGLLIKVLIFELITK